MERILKGAGAAVLGLLLSVGAEAQSHRHSGVVVMNDSRAVRTGGFVTERFPVPGLGFDFAHLAAINRGFQTESSVAVSRAVPFIPVLFPGYFPSYAPPPQVIVLQQPTPQVVVVPQSGMADDPRDAVEETREVRGRARHAEPRGDLGPARPTEPPRDVGEFVLVRRDGRVLFAIAFFSEGNKVTYVTREGVRRSLALSELDTDATVRMNEERGTTLHLPT